MKPASRAVHYSGILVVSPPRKLADCVRDLDSIPGVEVHHRHGPTGRIVAVQESASVEDQQDTLLRIRALPHVILAELVYHFVDSDPERAGDGPAAPGEEGE